MFSLFIASAIASAVFLFLGLHFLPTFVAVLRRNQHAFLIFVLNILVAWTVIGWIVLLVWAAVGEERREPYGRTQSFA